MIEKGELHWADAFVGPFFFLKESASFKKKALRGIALPA